VSYEGVRRVGMVVDEAQGEIQEAVRTIGYLTRGTLVFFWIACCLAFLYSATKVRTFRDLFVLFLQSGTNLEANVD